MTANAHQLPTNKALTTYGTTASPLPLVRADGGQACRNTINGFRNTIPRTTTYRIVPRSAIMHTMDTNDTDSRHWVDVPGWPRAHLASGHSSTVLVLTDEFEPGMPGGPYWLILCPWCKVTPFAIPAKKVKGNRKGLPSCGCMKGFGRNPNCHNGSRKISD